MTIQQPPLGPLEPSAMRARTTRLVASCGLGSASVFALAMLGWRHLDLVLNGISALAAAAWAAVLAAAVFAFGILVSVVTLGQQDLGYDVLCWLFLISWISCVIYKMDNSDDYADSLVSRLYCWSLIPHLALAICWGIHLFRWNESRPDALQINVVLLWILIAISVLGSLFVTAGLICAGLASGALERIGNGRPHPGRK